MITHPFCVDQGHLHKLSYATERTVEGLYPFQGEGVTSTGAVAQPCRFTQCILISAFETGATASTYWFPQMLHPSTGHSVVHLLRPTGFHRCNATVVIAPRRRPLRHQVLRLPRRVRPHDRGVPGPPEGPQREARQVPQPQPLARTIDAMSGRPAEGPPLVVDENA